MIFGRTKALIYVVAVLSTLLLVACLNDEEDPIPEPEFQQEIEMPDEIEEIELIALEIMELGDALHVIEKEIDTSEDGDENNHAEKITFDETLLLEVIAKELDILVEEGDDNQEEGIEIDLEQDKKELPDSTTPVWDEIKLKITEITEQWTELEPELISEDISSQHMREFENSLDELAKASTNEDQLALLTASNELTASLAEFTVPYANNCLPEAQKLKYHLRKVLLEMGSGNSSQAVEIADHMGNLHHYIEEEEELIEQSGEEEEKENSQGEEGKQEKEENKIYNKYLLSYQDLQNSLETEEPELVKLAGISVMENLVEMIDNL